MDIDERSARASISAAWDARRARWAAVVCLTAAAATVAYWYVWFTDRPLLASSRSASYLDFENAFPLADAWMTTALLVAAIACLRRRAAPARFWLVTAAASGLYLLCMDSLYDLEHRVWFTGGTAGLIELGVNTLTLAMSVVLWCLAPPHSAR
jgi:hypothetical protein